MDALARAFTSGERIIAMSASLLLLLSLLVLAARSGSETGSLTIEAPSESPEPAPSETAAVQTTPTPSPTGPVASPAGDLDFHDPSESDTSAPPRPVAAVASRATSWFGARYPDHHAATESASSPATTRWALLIGVNDHLGGTRDNIGSRQDAEDLAAHLFAEGWRRDHVLLLTDATATQRHIREGLAWLAEKTTNESVVVIHYSGHVKQWYGWDVDNDGETTDEALWPSDNRFITDSEFSNRVARIRADRLWVDIGGCEAAGFADAPIVRSRGVYTFSSEEDEKSYEDPSKDNSVWGWYLADRGLRHGYADADADGEVTVEEAFAYAAPRAAHRTSKQARGPQNPVIIDNLPGDFSLEIPPPPPPPPPNDPPDDAPTGGGPGGDVVPPPDEDEECLLVFC
ncbi:MAG: caspase family protein [Nitriliruptorales bacterium]|nr:caspase family protein [Nitriliruptorales bacterium]